ncbi:MBL fold metallo-hydrolase [Candidatus Woesearchaeota archaeon]|nr:MBL fold metallo-hydrolase [Candidatus Woesearchaeota archaeon]
MRVKFCGAAKIVTGSCYYIEVGNKRALVDCGMFQGTKDITRLNYEPFLFNPKKIDYLFLTHAHIDHSGLIPKLYREGFRGQIFATSATVYLCKIMLQDSAHIHEMDTEHENRRRTRQGLKEREPLYTQVDAAACMKLFKKIKYDEELSVCSEIKARYRDAGHIIGSSIIELFLNETGKQKKLVFSGDLGQWDVPIVKNPTLIDDADYIFVESTYGNRLHEKVEKREEALLDCINKSVENGGKLLVPSFAIERTQEILYSLNKLVKEKKMPRNYKIFLDSPLAIKATEIFKMHKETYDEETLKFGNPFQFSNLEYTPSAEDSRKLNTYNRPCMIIAGSGMCTAGRIRHHLKHGLWDRKNIVLFVGYQAEGTLGRHILRGDRKVRMMGMEVFVGATIKKINSFSAHADYKDLLRWLKHFNKGPKKVFIVHGEEDVAQEFEQKLNKSGLNDTHIPGLGEIVNL